MGVIEQMAEVKPTVRMRHEVGYHDEEFTVLRIIGTNGQCHYWTTEEDTRRRETSHLQLMHKGRWKLVLPSDAGWPDNIPGMVSDDLPDLPSGRYCWQSVGESEVLCISREGASIEMRNKVKPGRRFDYRLLRGKKIESAVLMGEHLIIGTGDWNVDNITVQAPYVLHAKTRNVLLNGSGTAIIIWSKP
jgi:hypothetical protein